MVPHPYSGILCWYFVENAWLIVDGQTYTRNEWSTISFYNAIELLIGYNQLIRSCYHFVLFCLVFSSLWFPDDGPRSAYMLLFGLNTSHSCKYHTQFQIFSLFTLVPPLIYLIMACTLLEQYVIIENHVFFSRCSTFSYLLDNEHAYELFILVKV